MSERGREESGRVSAVESTVSGVPWQGCGRGGG